ncbi:MAG TPA: protein kinase [Polyangiaceae bacterium]|nr:protein kinase [Polyangiaceae bacterium]
MALAYRTLSKFRLLARLGGGGMAEVYLAVAAGPGGFNKLQVLKVLRPDLPDADRTDFIQMFQDEARLAARLNHPNIVQSHGFGSEAGHDFIAMEYLDGQPLNRIQERGWSQEGDLPLEEQLFVLTQVLEALEYAHTLTDYDGTPLNIVHRDVSPQNVFVTYTGQIKLVDFGIAKTLESCQTRAGVVKGKVPYMAPEQVLGRRVDHRADLFSAGVMLWEAVARRRMHANDSVYETLQNLVQGDIPRLRDAAPDVPDELERIVERAIAHKPEARYDSASAFCHDVSTFLEGYRRVTAKAIGERVSGLFADERRSINDVIRQAMTEAAHSESGSQPIHLLPNLRALATATSSVVERDRIGESPTEPTAAPTTKPVRYTSTSPPVNVTPPPSLRSSAPKRWLAVASAALLLGLVGWGVLRARNGSGAPATVDVLASEPAAPQPSVRVNLRAVPSSAVLVLGGRPLPGNPYSGALARDLNAQILEVRAPGFDTRTLELRLDRDVDLEVRLSEVETPAAAKSEKKSAPRIGPGRVPARPPTRRGEQRPGSDDTYSEFPEPKRSSKPGAPALDTSDPWDPE